jgi:hypothetical protein
MVFLHHVNLAVAVGGTEDETAFLVDLLGDQSVPLAPGDPPTAAWFEGADGKQIHLSGDPDHRPGALAHVAVEFGDDLSGVLRKVDDAAYPYVHTPGDPTVFCNDPAGNRWELRGRGWARSRQRCPTGLTIAARVTPATLRRHDFVTTPCVSNRFLTD